MLNFVTDFDFYKDWILEDTNKRKLINTIKRYVKVPNSFDIGVRIIEKDSNDMQYKIMRRYDELVK